MTLTEHNFRIYFWMV